MERYGRLNACQPKGLTPTSRLETQQKKILLLEPRCYIAQDEKPQSILLIFLL